MKKKIISLITGVTAFCTLGSAFAASFSDLDEERYSWCYSEIVEMAEAGYVNGYEDGTFRPDNEVTKLEGISLFARAMGCGEEANAEILTLAHEKYDAMLKQCALSWGGDELAYMLYKGAFTESDLKTYVIDTLKNEPLNRGEAAVIMTKAMGGEKEAKSNTQVRLTYTDSKSIPSNYLRYVAYVSDHGIMQGTDNEFLAQNTVTRSQITLMLKRAADMCAYSFVEDKLTDLDAEEKTVTLDDKKYAYTDETVFNVKGETVDVSEFPKNVGVIVQLTEETVLSVDALTDSPDRTITAIYNSSSSSNGITRIKVKESPSSTELTSYECAADVSITYKSSPATFRSFQQGDSVQLVISNGKVVSVTAMDKVQTVKDITITDIDIDGDKVYITISSADKDYDGKRFEVASDVQVKKSNKDADMTEVYEGDKATVELRYGVIASINATSTRNSASGTIVSILIAVQPEITVRVDGNEKTYTVPQNCDIVVNQKSGSIYDFRVGDNVTITTVSNAVSKISTSTAVINTEGGVSGKVTAVNTSYGFLSVQTESSDVPYTVFKTSNQTTIVTTAGKTIDFKQINVGDTVVCNGTTTNGAFVAKLITVTPAK